MTMLAPTDLYDDLLKLKKENTGARRGISTGIPDLDKLILLNKTYLMLVTGNGGMGKSELIDQIAINTALDTGWKWVFFSPENFPISEHVKKYVERFHGKGLWNISPSEIAQALEKMDKHFTWLNPPDEKQNVRDLLLYVSEVKKEKGADAYVFDPWNEINHSEQSDMRDDQYLSLILTHIRKFNRKQDLLGCIVIHPKALQRDKEGNYPVPTLSDCHGGIMWRNKADYGISVHRHDMQKNEATVYVQKVKFKFMGGVGCLDLDYDFKSGRFKGKSDQEFLACWECPPPF